MSYSALHSHTMFSLLDGYGTPEEMLQQATNIGLNALAVTEHGNQYSYVYFDKLYRNYLYYNDLIDCINKRRRLYE